MKSEKRGWWWYDWWSICSRHQETKEGCRLCDTGHWERRASHRISSFFFKICPWGWRLWVNRKNSPSRRRLLGIFPNLQGKPGEKRDEPEHLNEKAER